MTDIVRFAIVGAGMMGREHIRNIKLASRAKVTALVDPVAASLEASMKTLGPDAAGVRTYADVPAMLADGGVDAVLIVSPNYTHRAVLGPLMDTDLAILCEKPLCTTVEDARWAAAAAAGRKSVFWTAMEYRYMPPVTRLVQEVHAGAVGRLVMLSVREHRFPFLPKVGDWNRFSRNTGGTMVEKCCHFFDLMRLVTGREAVSVFCSGAMDVNHLDERYEGQTPDIIDNSYTVVEFEGGLRAMLDLCMFAEGEEEQEAIAAIGDTAKLEVTIPRGDLIHSPRVPLGAPKAVTRTHVPVDPAALAAGTHHGSVYYQLEQFLDAVVDGAPVKVTAQDGLRAVMIGAAAELSAKEKRVVRLAEFG